MMRTGTKQQALLVVHCEVAGSFCKSAGGAVAACMLLRTEPSLHNRTQLVKNT
jgi:hypothetical protein